MLSVEVQAGPYTIVIADRGECNVGPNEPLEGQRITLGEYGGYTTYQVTLLRQRQRVASLVINAEGGPTSVRQESAFVVGSNLYLAIGLFVCAFELPSLWMLWQKEVDWGACFGIYHSPRYQRMVSHGELSVVSLDYSGNVLWTVSGKDVFSEEFAIDEETICATDFEHDKFWIQIKSGEMTTTAKI